MLALAAMVGAIVTAMRQAWVPALLLATIAFTLSLGARVRPPVNRPPPPPRPGMDLPEAASILGVAPDASVEDIQNAYVRLMRLVHPDRGGATGLAVQLNAARDIMLAARRREGRGG